MIGHYWLAHTLGALPVTHAVFLVGVVTFVAGVVVVWVLHTKRNEAGRLEHLHGEHWRVDERTDGRWSASFLGDDLGTVEDEWEALGLVLVAYSLRAIDAVRCYPPLGDPGGPFGPPAPTVRLVDARPQLGSNVLRFPPGA